MNPNNEIDIEQIRERAAMQREAFKRMHGQKTSGSTRKRPAVDQGYDPESTAGTESARTDSYTGRNTQSYPRYDYAYQPGYDNPAAKTTPEPRERGGSMGIMALILGILSILFFWTMPFAIMIALAGIITAVHVRSRSNGKGLGTAALITSIIGMILAVFLTGFVMMNSERILEAFDKIEDQIIEEYGEDFYNDPFGQLPHSSSGGNLGGNQHMYYFDETV